MIASSFCKVLKLAAWKPLFVFSVQNKHQRSPKAVWSPQIKKNTIAQPISTSSRLVLFSWFHGLIMGFSWDPWENPGKIPWFSHGLTIYITICSWDFPMGKSHENPMGFSLNPSPRCHRLAQLRDDFGQQLRTHQVLGVGRRNVPGNVPRPSRF